MYDWPQQASDAELDAAAALGGRMHDEGFAVLTFSDLTAGDDTAVLSPWDARVGLLRAGVAEVRYEPTGEEQVADVTRVCGEVWLRAFAANPEAAAVYSTLRRLNHDAALQFALTCAPLLTPNPGTMHRPKRKAP